MKRSIFLLVLFAFTSSSTCNRNKIGCTESNYNFEATAKINNQSDSIALGDTIWLEINSPVSQIDGLSGKVIKFDNAINLGTAIGIGEIIKPSLREAADDFNYYLVYGVQLQNPNTNIVREFLFEEKPSVYQLKLGLIPKIRGYFSIGLSNAANVYRNGDNCNKAGYKIYYAATKLHLYLFKEVYGTQPDSTSISPYCFKVK